MSTVTFFYFVVLFFLESTICLPTCLLLAWLSDCLYNYFLFVYVFTLFYIMFMSILLTFAHILAILLPTYVHRS